MSNREAFEQAYAEDNNCDLEWCQSQRLANGQLSGPVHGKSLALVAAGQGCSVSEVQLDLIPHDVTLPYPPRHMGFLEPEREVPGYTLEQMLEYGRACAAEALKQTK